MPTCLPERVPACLLTYPVGAARPSPAGRRAAGAVGAAAAAKLSVKRDEMRETSIVTGIDEV